MCERASEREREVNRWCASVYPSRSQMTRVRTILNPKVRRGADLSVGRSTPTSRGADSGLAKHDATALNYRKAAEEKLNCISRFESRDKGAQAYSRQGQTSISPEARRSRTSASPEAGRHKAAGAPPAGTRTSVSPHRHHLHHSEISDHKSRGHVPAWEPALKQINVVQHAARPHIQREG